MYELVDFLVEERYCNSELEALKIIESISDEFYKYLLEEYNINKFAPERVRAIKDKIKRLKKQAQENPLSIKDPEKFRTRIDMLQGTLDGTVDNQSKKAKDETQRRIDTGEVKQNKGGLPTPRGPGGSRFQKGRDVISTSGSLPGVTKASNYKLKQLATRLTGISPEAENAGGSRQKTGENVHSLFDPNDVSGGRGTGTTRTGGRTPRV